MGKCNLSWVSKTHHEEVKLLMRNWNSSWESETHHEEVKLLIRNETPHEKVKLLMGKWNSSWESETHHEEVKLIMRNETYHEKVKLFMRKWKCLFGIFSIVRLFFPKCVTSDLLNYHYRNFWKIQIINSSTGVFQCQLGNVIWGVFHNKIMFHFANINLEYIFWETFLN